MEKREIEIKNARLEDVFNKRNEIQKEINKAVDDMEKIQKELSKLGIKMTKQKERAVVEVQKLKLGLTEFEIIESFDMKDGKLVMIIADEVEMYKDALRKRKNMEQTPAEEIKTEEVAPE